MSDESFIVFEEKEIFNPKFIILIFLMIAVFFVFFVSIIFNDAKSFLVSLFSIGFVLSLVFWSYEPEKIVVRRERKFVKLKELKR